MSNNKFKTVDNQSLHRETLLYICDRIHVRSEPLIDDCDYGMLNRLYVAIKRATGHEQNKLSESLWLELAGVALHLSHSNSDKLINTLLTKNRAYGNSFSDSWQEYGAISGLVRVGDKMNRIRTLTANQETKENDESLVDTLLDLSGYAVLNYIELRRHK